MPETAHARIPTTEASRLIKRLLTHWGHKFEVSYDAQHGKVPFDTTTHATFDASDEALDVRIEAETPERLARMQQVVADHLHRMARAGALQIEWQAGAP